MNTKQERRGDCEKRRACLHRPMDEMKIGRIYVVGAVAAAAFPKHTLPTVGRSNWRRDAVEEADHVEITAQLSRQLAGGWRAGGLPVSTP